MIINQLDLGAPSHPQMLPVVGQNVDSTVIVEGFEPAVFSHGSIERKQTVTFGVRQWQAIGGQSANTYGGMRYLLKQIEELASNRDMQPVYIQWTATADPAALLNASEYHDGWYYIDDFEPDYSRNVVTGMVMCRMTVTQVAAAPPRSVALSYTGGALSSNFSGTALNLVSLPIGSTALESTFNRTGAEGSIPCVLSPAASPEQFVLSGTIANWFKGGVHVYDTINTTNNPVPTSGGTFVNANWVEVFYTDHDFQGDCVITNGLQLILVSVGIGLATLATFYLWNTALATANWQSWATLHGLDNASSNYSNDAYSLIRVGAEESSVVITMSTGQNIALLTLRLQRGRYEIRGDLNERTQANTGASSLFLGLAAQGKVNYNPSAVTDNIVGAVNLAADTTYGYAATFIASTSQPSIAGFLYQNQPANQPTPAASPNVSLGDTSGPAVNAQRSYGVFAVPYGVSGSYSTANLQAEAESGALGTGWTNIVDAAASNGHTANLANGTASGNADLWGTSFVPAAGVYDLWVRMKATTHTSATAQLQIGLWDTTSSAFVASTTYAPNQVTGSYVWYRVAASVTPTATHNMQVRAVTTATTTDAWQIDESSLNPLSLTTANTGPQDIYQQWAYDRSTKWIRP